MSSRRPPTKCPHCGSDVESSSGEYATYVCETTAWYDRHREQWHYGRSVICRVIEADALRAIVANLPKDHAGATLYPGAVCLWADPDAYHGDAMRVTVEAVAADYVTIDAMPRSSVPFNVDPDALTRVDDE